MLVPVQHPTTHKAYRIDVPTTRVTDVWHIESLKAQNDAPWLNIDTCVIEDMQHNPICLIDYSASGYVQANKTLILAAPDLLSCLSGIVTRLERERDEREAKGESPVFPCAALIEDARRVINLAKGE